MKLVRTLAALVLVAGLAFAQTVDYFSFTTDQAHVDELEGLIEVFEAQNPGITIAYTTAPFDGYFTRLQTDFAAGSPPDVFELNFENFVTFASRGALAPLDERLAADRSRRLLHGRARRLRVRQRPVRAADHLLDGRAVLQPGPVRRRRRRVPHRRLEMGRRHGGRRGDLGSDRPRLGDLPARAVLGVLQGRASGRRRVAGRADGRDRHPREPRRARLPRRQDRGRRYADRRTAVGRRQRGPVRQRPVRHARLGYLDVRPLRPVLLCLGHRGRAGRRRQATHFFSNAAAIAASSPDREAAWKWVEFLAASPEVAAARIESAWELPALSLDNAATLAPYLARPQPANREAVFASLAFAVNPPVVDRQPELQDIVNQELEAARLGSKTPAQALADAQRRVEALLAD